MSRFLPESVRPVKPTHFVGLNARAAAWLVPSATGLLHWQKMAWDPCSPGFNEAVVVKSIVNLVQTSPQQKIAWILAPSLARNWLQAPSQQIGSLTELHAVAQARASQLFGEGASSAAGREHWAVTGDWQASRSFLCAAMPSVWSESLQFVMTPGKGNSIHTPLTLALAHFEGQLPNSGWLALAIAGELCIMRRTAERVTRLRSLRLPVNSTPESAEALAIAEWQREVLRSQDSSLHLHWLCLMPDNGAKVYSSAVQAIEWTHSKQLIAPASANFEDQSSEDQIALQETMQTAWCGQQLLSGEAR